MFTDDYYIFKNISPKIAKDADGHITQGDEDSTVATVLDLLRQNMAKNGFTEKSDLAIKKMVTRMVYRQQQYRFVPKNQLPSQLVAMGSTYLLTCDK